jgi:LysR family transcriptional regulator, low CO2-responsive transcriptional regulator
MRMSARDVFPTARQLALVAAVADHGGVLAAAQSLGISQPAVTAQLRAAERLLGHALFRRTPSGMAPTPAGRAVAAYARRQSSQRRGLLASIAGLKAGRSGTLLVAGSSTTGEHWLPERVMTFRRRHPEVDVRVSIGNSEETLALIASGAVDVAVTGARKRLRGLAFFEVGMDNVVIVAARGSRWTRGTIRARSLAEATFVVREEGSASRAAGLACLRRLGIAPPRLMPLASNEAVARMAAADLGIGILSARSAQSHVEEGRLAVVRVHGFRCRARLYVCRRTDGANRLADEFVALALERRAGRR